MSKHEAAHIGLCERCQHARVIETGRSRFWMCALSATSPRFDKYPRLPVLACDGFEAGTPNDSRGSHEGEKDR